MFKLVVLSGPNVGTSYRLGNGVTSVGRQEGNSIVLPSERVSKLHCTLAVVSHHVLVKDQGSSNGTFINGTLIKSKRIRPGDRISVGDYIFQLVEVKVVKPPQQAKKNPTSELVSQSSIKSDSSFDISNPRTEAAPSDFLGKIIWIFNHSIMPPLYGLLMRTEWRIICLGFFFLFCLGSTVISVYPVLESNREGIIREVKSRARYMAKQISDQNANFLAAGMQTKADIGSTEQGDGVRVAVIVDLDSRIIAPNSKLNQYLTSGPEATAAVKAKDLFRSGRETGLTLVDESGVIIALEPVKVLNPALGRNVVAAMSIVSIDSTLSTSGAGETGVVYFETLIFITLLGCLIFVILYKITLRPFVTLNEDMDRALKGDLPQVTHEYQMEELDFLWEIINSAIQRIPRRTESASGFLSAEFGGDQNVAPEEFEGAVKMLGGVAKLGVVGFSAAKQIIYLNSIFEELSGIRLDAAVGQTMASVARDQSLGLLADELLDRASPGSEGSSDEYELSGIPYRVMAASFGNSGQRPKFFIMVFERKE